MAIQEYECNRGHKTIRSMSMSESPGPEYIKCKVHLSTTHSPGCAKFHSCGLRARRVEVYKVSVGGDLPTRGSF